MSVRILHGDCRELLPTLPSDSVHCVVTSPPYWGLRDYGTALWQGGDDGCDHLHKTGGTEASTLGLASGGNDMTDAARLRSTERSFVPYARCCGKCGATRIDRQMGMEATYQEHVAAMADVFDEVRRVLRPDGTLWLNYGDSYASSINGRSAADTKLNGHDDRTFRDKPFSTIQGTLKPKDLCGIPWRVAFALQDRGWYLRQDIIWSKPNPMPESVTDRCTKAHEYVFLFAKRPRYFFDAEAIAEPSLRFGETVRTNGAAGMDTFGDGMRTRDGFARGVVVGETRNKRSVWTISTRSFSEAHFATFPPELVETCIKAGTSEKGCCAGCGKPWVRMVERTTSFQGGSGAAGRTAADVNGNGKWAGRQYGTNIKLGPVTSTTTLGWRPSCACGAAVVPCTVLDPFGGAGTTGLVADRLRRHAILIELSENYADMSRARLVRDAGMFADFHQED